jgi:hypothetical protein
MSLRRAVLSFLISLQGPLAASSPYNYAIVAERLGVTRQAVSQIVSGKRKPAPRILRKLGLQEIVIFQKVSKHSADWFDILFDAPSLLTEGSR